MLTAKISTEFFILFAYIGFFKRGQLRVEEFDVIVLGGGKGGKTLAIELGKAGKKTALIERKMIGGSCINVACIPTKTMIESAKIAEKFGRSLSFGVETEGIRVLQERIIGRKKSVVEEMRAANYRQFVSTPNLDFMMGQGRFIAEKEIEVHLEEGVKRTLRANQIVINTGSRPAVPKIAGIEKVPYFTSETLIDQTFVPEELLIIGGGYIGLEFAQMYRRFGSRVALVQQRAQILPREDADIAEIIREQLEEEGIRFYLESKPMQVHAEKGKIVLEIADARHRKSQLIGTHLLVAAGRKPNTEELGLSKTGVDLDAKGFIKVDAKLQTTHPSIWALGDVNGGPQFTHISLDDFRIVRSQLLGGNPRLATDRLVPYTLFVDPALGRVGLTEKEAVAKGYAVRIFKVKVNDIPRAKTTDERKGVWKAVVDAKTDLILGVALLSADGGEILGTIQMAMLGKFPYTILRDMIFSHPTLVEGLNMLFAPSSRSVALTATKL
jgi:probable pyridine nucleotide-disulfide oxidoreductase